MEIDLVIKNYRCFADSHPAKIALRPGFTGLIGANNSGKSSLLRMLYELRSLFQVASQAGNLTGPLRSQRQVFNTADGIRDTSEIFCNRNDRDLSIEITALKDGANTPGELPGPRKVTLVVQRPTNQYLATVEADSQPQNPDTNTWGFSGDILSTGAQQWLDMTYFHEACRLLGSTLYVGSFRNPVNVGGGNYLDIQTGSAFINAWKHYKAGSTKANREAALRLTDDIKRIFGFDELEITPAADDSTLILNIDKRTYRLDEQGSGLAHFIIVLANVATRRPAYVLIDEPEAGLHPSLQLDFLTTLASYSSEGVLFATHQLGLARSSANFLYSLRRTAEGESQVTPFEDTPDLAEFMGELGFAAYQELGFDQVLLVEGPSELKTIQQLLRHYGKEHSVVLLSLGGTQMINATTQTALDHVRRITDNVVALIDSERKKEGDELVADRAQFVATCAKAKIRCVVLDRRALENYFPERAIRAVKGEKYRALDPFEKLSDVKPSWGKSENWRIAREMTTNDLSSSDLGKFLETL